MSVTLIRHTRPDVAYGICYGCTDLPVATSFDQEADKILNGLEQAEVLISSPLLRCRKLAERIGTAFELMPVYDSRLQEINFGSWEGQRWEDIPRREIEFWAADFLHARPHGGESVRMLERRVHELLNELLKDKRSHLVVTHAGVIKVASRFRDRNSENWPDSIGFGEFIKI